MARWFGRSARLSFQPWGTWAAACAPADAEATLDHIAHSPSMSIDKACRALAYHPRYSSLEAVFESLTWLVDHGQVNPSGHRLSFSEALSQGEYAFQ